jgi:hypothetical protein
LFVSLRNRQRRLCEREQKSGSFKVGYQTLAASSSFLEAKFKVTLNGDQILDGNDKDHKLTLVTTLKILRKNLRDPYE